MRDGIIDKLIFAHLESFCYNFLTKNSPADFCIIGGLVETGGKKVRLARQIQVQVLRRVQATLQSARGRRAPFGSCNPTDASSDIHAVPCPSSYLNCNLAST